MRLNCENQTYFFSERDLALMSQTGISWNEIMAHKPKQSGLPLLWSRLTYMMLYQWGSVDTKLFWKAYREFDTLLKDTDSHYTPAYIPKSNGQKRPLLVPDEELRSHQRLILHDILYHIPVSAYACAYRKGQGLVDLAAPHQRHETLIHLDIQDFFSSITEQMVFEALCNETSYPKAVAGFLSRLCCYRHHLPQGACTSPALSNICFKKCDEEIANLAKAHQLTYTRYSDDLYLSGDGVDAGAVIGAVKAVLAQQGFRVRSEKTRVLGKHQAQKVTAIVVNEKMQTSREYRRKLRQELYYLKRFGENAEGACAAASYRSYLYQLLGKVTFVLYVDPSNKEFSEAKRMLESQLV